MLALVMAMLPFEVEVGASWCETNMTTVGTVPLHAPVAPA